MKLIRKEMALQGAWLLLFIFGFIYFNSPNYWEQKPFYGDEVKTEKSSGDGGFKISAPDHFSPNQEYNGN